MDHQTTADREALSLALRLSNARVLQAVQQALITVDDAQRVVMFNTAAQRMFGCTEEQAMGSELSRFLPERYRAGHAEQVQTFCASGTASRQMGQNADLRGLRADGTEFPLAATIVRSASPVGITPAGPTLLSALLSDLSGEQCLLAELDALRQQFQSLFEAAPVAIIVVEQTRVVLANQASVDMLRAGHMTELLGRSILEFIEPKAHRALNEAIEHALLHAGEISTVQQPLRCLDGSTLKVEIAVVAFEHPARAAAQLVVTDVTSHSTSLEVLLRSGDALRRLSGSLIDAREEERRRISRELHDELGQRLSALKMGLVGLGTELHGRASQKQLEAMLGTLDGIVAAMRRIAADLRPLMLDDLGLNAAIEWLAHESARRLGLEVSVDLDETEPPADHRMATALYRMVQEALANVGNHAGARRVWISLHRVGEVIELTVWDDGMGFPDPMPTRDDAFGLLGMSERAALLGGRLVFDNAPEGGARVRVQLPLSGTEAAATGRATP
ncbi:PAS domain-containing sensor histidine kinase [Roseateles toxinivorans]|uniref:Two-component system sensor histidine kinase UhpB n=1 Tax=Roseateles toxinivorans TaxID=270368 RepID=A0A4R6QLL2_9BURK|nr:PAS domain-containing protein [Roseateles toxinivorans]TDP64122.1 two-component system sensor histidine kinase UhpB [Roseateles toxinivorans]